MIIHIYIYIHSNCYSIFLRFTFGPFTRMPVGNDPVPTGSTFFSRLGRARMKPRQRRKWQLGLENATGYVGLEVESTIT